MADLFISYAHDDNKLVIGDFSIHHLTETLQDLGYSLWMDNSNIPGGQVWKDEIETGIKNAKYVLVIATENSARSGSYVLEEIRLAKKNNKAIIPLFLETTYLETLGVAQYQGIDFSKPFDEALERLIKFIPDAVPQTNRLYYKDLPDIFEEGTMTFGEAENRWRTSLSFGKKPDAPVGLLIGRSPHDMSAFLVGRRDAQLTIPDSVQVFLQFTDSVKKSAFQTYLEYITTVNKRLWTILVRASIVLDDEQGHIFALSNDDQSEWEEAIRFILEALSLGRRTCRHVEFYLQAPGALIMALGLREKFYFQCDVYHFSRGNPPKDQLYHLVYTKSR